MPSNVDAYIPAFEQGIRTMLPAQRTSKLMGLFPSVQMNGKRHTFRRRAPEDLAEKTTAYETISPVGGTYSFRSIVATPYRKVFSYETEQEVRAALQFQNGDAQELVAAIARKFDDVVIGSSSGTGGLLGSAITGEDGTGTQAITQTQTLSNGLNWNELMKAARTFRSANIDDSMPKYLIATPKMYEQLMLDDIVSSEKVNPYMAFANQKVEQLLATGEIQQIGGWNLIIHRDADLLTSSTANIGIAFVADALVVGMGTGPTVESFRDTSRYTTWHTTGYIDIGAGRAYEEGVIRLDATVPST